MRRLIVAAAEAACLLLVPGSATSATKVYLPGCTPTDESTFKPKTYLVACGDGSFSLVKMKWSSWGSKTAAGSGKAAINTCEPNCADGKFKRYKVTVKLTKPKTCSGVKVWTRLEIDFASSPPAGLPAKYKTPLSCFSDQQQG